MGNIALEIALPGGAGLGRKAAVSFLRFNEDFNGLFYVVVEAFKT